MRFGVGAALSLAVLALAPAAVQARASDPVAADVEKLRAGQYLWIEQPEIVAASIGAETPVSIVVSLPDQRAYVYRAGKLVGVSTVSTGSDGHETPVGEFTILQKKTFHRSNLYSNAPMPFMQRLTWDGIAMHAGHLPGYPASHGCIRFPKAFARDLYELTELGGSVSVIDVPVYDPELDIYSPLSPLLTADAKDLGGDAFSVVTMRGDPPPDMPAQRPASWVTGPAKEVVQPLPKGK